MTKTAINPVLIATGWMAGALLSFMVMALGGRELAPHMSTFQILFFRSFIGLITVALLLSRSGWYQIKTKRFTLHLWRNIAHYGGQYGWFYGLGVIPLAEVFALEFTVPIWTAVLATLFLKEKMTKSRITAVVLGFIGMLIILRPGFAVINPASLAVLGAAIGYAVSHTFTRKLILTDTPLAVLFYMTLIQIPFGLLPALNSWVTPTSTHWFWLIAVGVAALGAHFCMAKAFQLADATVVVPMDFLRLPLIAFIGYLFYAEALDQFVLIGALFMLAGNYINIRFEQKTTPVLVEG